MEVTRNEVAVLITALETVGSAPGSEVTISNPSSSIPVSRRSQLGDFHTERTIDHYCRKIYRLCKQ